MRHDIPGREKSEGSRAIIAHKPFCARQRLYRGRRIWMHKCPTFRTTPFNAALGEVHLCFCEEREREREREVQLNQTLVALSPLHDRGEASDDWWPRSQTMSWLDWIKTITATYSLLLVHIYLGHAAKTISGLRQKGWHENDKIMASLVNIWSKAPQQSKGIVFRKSFFILSCLMWDRSTIGHSISERLRKCVALCIYCMSAWNKLFLPRFQQSVHMHWRLLVLRRWTSINDVLL